MLKATYDYYLSSLKDNLERAKNDLVFVETLLSDLVDSNKRLCEILAGLQARLKKVESKAYDLQARLEASKKS